MRKVYAPVPIPAGMTVLEEDQEELEDWRALSDEEEEQETEEDGDVL
jgi:hypothetical protein